MTPRDLASRVAMGAGLALAPLAVLAAQWTLEPSVTATGEYQSNPQLNAADVRSGTSTYLQLSLPLSWNDGRSRVDVMPSANAGTNRGAAGLGVDNRALDVAALRTGTRYDLRAGAQYVRSSLFGADVVDLGLVRPDGRRISRRDSIGITWRASERDTLRLDARRIDERFDAPTSAFVDYRYSSVGAQYQRDLSPRWQALAVLSTGRFTPDVGPNRATDWSAQVGAAYAIRDGWVVTATGGRTEQRNLATGRTERGAAYDASLDWRGLLARANLRASRSRQPSAVGTLAEQTDYTLSAALPLSPYMEVSASVGSSRYLDTFVGFAFDDRAYRRATIGLDRALSPAWTLILRAQYVRAEYAATLFRAAALSTQSTGGSISLTRRFGRVEPFGP